MPETTVVPVSVPSLADLWRPFYLRGFQRGIFGVLEGYIDESKSDGGIFSLSCVFTDGETWGQLTRDWQSALEQTNQKLASANRKPISRYHATDCSTRHNEFEGWTTPEQIAFFSQFLAVLRKYPLNGSGYTLHLKELVEELPEVGEHGIAFSYSILLKYIMNDIGYYIATSQDSERQISLFHDRAKSFVHVLQFSFLSHLADPLFQYAAEFITLAPMGWETCLPLQPADLFAYENMKETQRHFDQRDRRQSLSAILDLPLFGGRLTHLDRGMLPQLRPYIEADENTKKIIGLLPKDGIE